MGTEAIDILLRQRGFGGIIRKEAPLEPYFAHLRKAFGHAAQYVNPRFRFVFIEDGTINGLAYSGMWRSYVGLTFGSVSMLEAIWRLLLRSGHLFEHLSGGEDREELRREIQTTFHLCVVGIDRTEVPDSYFTELKKSACAERSELSYNLFKRSLLFLYYHELSHLGRGHPMLCQAADAPPVVLEAQGSSEKIGHGSDARHWAELEADWLATIWLLQSESWQQEEEANIGILFELFFSIGVVLLIFSLAEEKLGNLTRDHPHPALRLAHLFEETAEFLVDGDRYPFTSSAPIHAAAEKALEELSIVGVVAGFDWYKSAERETSNAKERIREIRFKAGRPWVEAANAAMRKFIKRPPPKI